jgi:dienelactone hydrolase
LRPWLTALLAVAMPQAMGGPPQAEGRSIHGAQPVVSPAPPEPAGAGTADAPPSELVGFVGEPRQGRAPARIEGVLLRPPGAGPFPAIAMLHGCTGLRTPNRAIQAKPRFWAEHFRDRGYVTLLVDSFTPRGIDEVCTGRHLLSPVRDRADDARGALRYLQARSDVRPDRVGLLGWSNGAAATLSVLFDGGAVARDYRAAVAFYPNCTRNYPGGPDFRPYAPLFLLVGALDDWTPAAPCVSLIERARVLGAPVTIKVYPGAHHSFDSPGTSVRYRPEVRNHSKQGDCSGATVGTDPAARADAIVQVTRFFAGELGGGEP